MATSIKTKNGALVLMMSIAIFGCILVGKQLYEIEQFNRTVQAGGKPTNTNYKFEAKYASAYGLAKSGRYQDAAQLFGQLMESKGTASQISAVQYDLGNIYLLRGLMVHRNGDTVKDEAEYLINQAKMAYQQSLRLDNTHMDARHNFDRVLRLLPENSVPKDDQDELGIIMGNIPTGLP